MGYLIPETIWRNVENKAFLFEVLDAMKVIPQEKIGQDSILL
jgi:hypothetical protein